VPSLETHENAIAVPAHCVYLWVSMRNLFGLILLASTAVVACTRSSREDAAESATATAAIEVKAPLPQNTATSTPTSSDCPRTGLWALCSVERRLGQSGFVVRRINGQAPRRPGFSVQPAAYTLGRSRLEVFIYPSESAVAADVAKLDTATAAPRGAQNPWPFFTPTFVRSGNLVAVFLTESETQAERLTLALAAGAPQP
jgi:hypothetical protein